MDFNLFMKEYDKATSSANKERALWNLLKSQEVVVKEYFETDINYFHKAFRQVDVTASGYLDTAIWELLDEATIFWEVLESLNNTSV